MAVLPAPVGATMTRCWPLSRTAGTAADWTGLKVRCGSSSFQSSDTRSAELGRGVLAAAIAVDHALGLQSAAAVGHVESVDDEFGAVVVGHGIADDLAGGQVQPAGEVEPALGGRQVSDVANQLDAGTLGVEVAADEVRGRLRLLVRPGQRAVLAPGDAADVAFAHDAGDALAVHPLPQAPQFGVDARDAIGLPGGDVQHGDLVRERVVGRLALAGSPARRWPPRSGEGRPKRPTARRRHRVRRTRPGRLPGRRK